MKRIVVAVMGLAWVVLVPAFALAQEGSDLGEPNGPQIAGSGGSIGGVGGGSAFTGAEVAGLIALAVALVVLGVAAVVLTRRRAASTLGN